MKYSELAATATYRSGLAGAGVRVMIYRVSDRQTVLVGSTAGISPSDDFEVVSLEEAGSNGVDELVSGRHTGQCNVQGYFRLETNDLLPTRDTNLGEGDGEEYVVMQIMGDKRVGVRIPINVYEGCKITRYTPGSHGARGVLNFDLSFLYKRRYNGRQWMNKTGDPNFV